MRDYVWYIQMYHTFDNPTLLFTKTLKVAKTQLPILRAIPERKALWLSSIRMPTTYIRVDQ